MPFRSTLNICPHKTGLVWNVGYASSRPSDALKQSADLVRLLQLTVLCYRQCHYLYESVLKYSIGSEFRGGGGF